MLIFAIQTDTSAHVCDQKVSHVPGLDWGGHPGGSVRGSTTTGESDRPHPQSPTPALAVCHEVGCDSLCPDQRMQDDLILTRPALLAPSTDKGLKKILQRSAG